MKRERLRQAMVVLMLPLSIAAAAQGHKVSLHANGQSLTDILYQVERQSDYYKINYNAGDLKAFKVTHDIAGLSAPDAVRQLTADLPLTVSVKGRYIQINKNNQDSKAPTFVTASGRILDAQGEPLVGVSIQVDGTATGTITDSDGRYTLPGVRSDAMLTYSYIGMKPYHRRVSTKPVTIILESDGITIGDVMVTGYQTLKREDVTGSFQTLSSKDIDKRYASSLRGRLEGLVPGLVDYNNGNSSGLVIRGVGSLNASTSPLIVVDGLPISGGLSDVNPYDVDKITVLKDAAASAVYGARASNGVIVITTKKANSEKLTVDFNADLTRYNKYNYNDYDYCNAAEQLELEQYNFQWMMNDADAKSYMQKQYKRRGGLMSPITKLMMRHQLGEISDDEYNSTIKQWSHNSYRNEYADLMDRNELLRQYNLALRTKGRYLNSSVVVNWKGDNTSTKNQYNNTLTMQYNGDLDVTKWLNMRFGVALNNNRKRMRATGDYDLSSRTSFADYQSMYNADGTPATLQAYVDLNEPSLKDVSLGLKDEGYVPVNEIDMNHEKSRETYTRSFVHLNLMPLDGLKLSAMFQYEDVSDRSEKLINGESYSMRHLYNLFTTGGKHNLPEGGLMTINSGEGNYYTFRTQASYNTTLNKVHGIEAIAGYEYRQTFDRTTYNQMYGYDEQTLTNSTGLINFNDLINSESTDLGSLYSPQYSFLSSDVAGATHIKHKYQSYYATANYVYDSRYAASASYRVDEADLFGASSKFRHRPLWSAGLSWNAHNEEFIKQLGWIDMLKLRMSYGVTGNINSNYSSYLTAKIHTTDLTGDKYASLNTPPNDELRWEKTRTWNGGLDFAVLDHRISGSLDFYHKKGSDILASIDLDPTTGWSSQRTNNAEMVNKGVELQLSSDILRAHNDNEVGLSMDFTLAYNKNKITRLHHQPTSGVSALDSYREGDPVNSLYSFRFGHVETDEDGYQQIFWKKADGTEVSDNLYSSAFTKDDIVFSGSLDPKWTGSLTPTITWKRFSLSGMFNFYAGHYFRAKAYKWRSTASSSYGYEVPRAYLDYWRASEEDRKNMLGNGYMMMHTNFYTDQLYYCDQDVDHADYMKLRNLVLGYDLPDALCTRLGLQAIRLRLQMSNVATWVRNSEGIDPESVNPSTGARGLKAPKSYTLSVNVKF